jgi:hypothetical protein
MKILAFLAILLVLVSFVFAKTDTVILAIGESHVVDDNNVTLIDYDKREDKVLVCVNGKKGIVTDERRIGDVYIEIKTFKDNGVRMSLEANCDECRVRDNSECFPKAVKEIEESEIVEEKELEEIEEKGEVKEVVELEEENEEEKYKGILGSFFSLILSLFR